MIAIIITIMALELKVPHGDDLAALAGAAPVFLSYVLSFVYIAIYWNNHHHFFHLVRRVDGSMLWANLHLLFWLSLIPFATAWMGENRFAPVPTAAYGIALVMPALAWQVLQFAIIRTHGRDSALAQAWPRSQREAFAAALSDGSSACFCRCLGGGRSVRRGGADVARARPAYRKNGWARVKRTPMSWLK